MEFLFIKQSVKLLLAVGVITDPLLDKFWSVTTPTRGKCIYHGWLGYDFFRLRKSIIDLYGTHGSRL